MKRIALLFFCLLISHLVFSQKNDIVGFWEITKMSVSLKTDKPFSLSEIKEEFVENYLKNNGKMPTINFTPEGYAVDNMDGRPFEYSIDGDSLQLDELKGLLIIEGDKMILRSDQLKRYKGVLEREIKDRYFPDLPELFPAPIRVEEVIVDVCFEKTDKEFDVEEVGVWKAFDFEAVQVEECLN